MSLMRTAKAMRAVSRHPLIPHTTLRVLRRLPAPPQQSLRQYYLLRPSFLRAIPKTTSAIHIRQQSSTATERPLTDRAEDGIEHDMDVEARRAQEPAYNLTFTCKKCSERSTHRVTKQGYHHGTILITCPECKNRHLISDHLKIFSDKSITLEDIMREKGQYLKKGRLGENGDIEFYADVNQVG